MRETDRRAIARIMMKVGHLNPGDSYQVGFREAVRELAGHRQTPRVQEVADRERDRIRREAVEHSEVTARVVGYLSGYADGVLYLDAQRARYSRGEREPLQGTPEASLPPESWPINRAEAGDAP